MRKAAADTLAWLITEACKRGLTGVGLKDERGAGAAALHAADEEE